jgi:hypothetical protein
VDAAARTNTYTRQPSGLTFAGVPQLCSWHNGW